MSLEELVFVQKLGFQLRISSAQGEACSELEVSKAFPAASSPAAVLSCCSSHARSTGLP